MVALQIISKVLETKDFSIISDNILDDNYFLEYKEEFTFIREHYEKYGNVPDKVTFEQKFPDIQLVEVTESDDYLVATIREEKLYSDAVPIVNEIARLMKTDANAATEYLMNNLDILRPTYELKGTDIIKDSLSRLAQYEDKKNNPEKWTITTGFEELDNIIHGIDKEMEFFIIFARTNQCKSWVLAKLCTHIWQLGFNIGFVSPEMSPMSIGYRFDTLHKNFSNTALMYGGTNIDEEEYVEYIAGLKENKNKFIVSTPNDFGKKITVSKLKKYIQQYHLDVLAIDGITYLSDERGKRGDSKTITLTNISEDLVALSLELHVPILVVVQSNRGGVMDKDTDGTPDLENIRDSDGIAQNATKVLSLRQKDNVLEMCIKKSRFGKIGGLLKYLINLDVGKFTFLPSEDDAEPEKETKERVKKLNKKFKDKSDVF